MDNHNLLRKYATRPDADGPNVVEMETEDMGSFGVLRGIRDRCTMLELRLRTGNVRAVSYAYVNYIDYDPAVGVTISVGGPKVLIKGRNLNAEIRPNVRLFEALTRQRVSWVRELGQTESMEAAEAACAVDAIEW